MRLTPELVVQYTLGCDHVATIADGAYFHRFQPSLAQHYEYQPARRIRRDCPSGVRIRFVSDTTGLRLGLRLGEAARPFFQAVVLVDGVAYPLGPTEATAEWSGAIAVPGTSVMRLFDIWLPHLAVASLSHLELDDGARIAAAPPCRRRWLAYGDSITQGMTVPLPHETHIARVTRRFDAHTRNLGVGGERLQAYLADTVPDRPFDLCTIAYGVNDCNNNVRLDEFAANARSLATALARISPGKPVVFITPIPWLTKKTHNDNGDTLEDFRAALKTVAASLPQTHCVNGTDLVAAEPDLFCDGCHPNERGAAMYAARLTEALRPFMS